MKAGWSEDDLFQMGKKPLEFTELDVALHRGQFFSICAQMMRRILIDAARSRRAARRGSHVLKLNIEAPAPVSAESGETILALHDALEAFAQIAHRQARVVELR